MMDEAMKNAIVVYRLENADKTLAEVSILIRNELWNTAVNRLYYACYYVVTALLINSGIDAKTHVGVRRMLALHFTKTGKLSIQWNKYYTDLFNSRQTGDYADFMDFDRKTVEELHEQAASFIKVIKELIV